MQALFGEKEERQNKRIIIIIKNEYKRKEAFFTNEVFRLYKMECKEELCFSLPSIPRGRSHEVRVALDFLLSHGAVAGKFVPLPVDIPGRDSVLGALAHLQTHGCVDRIIEGAVEATWMLTSFGKSRLVSGNVLTNPTSILKPRPGIPVQDWSHIELMMYLRAQKWLALPWKKGHRCPEPLRLPEAIVAGASGSSDAAPVLPEGLRCWYYRPFEPRVGWNYLSAMVHLHKYGMALHAAGIREVPHNASCKYYDMVIQIALGKKRLEDLPSLLQTIPFETEGNTN